MFQKPRGTRDFLPEEMKKRRFVENKLREVFERYGYKEILTPTFESFELIAKKQEKRLESSCMCLRTMVGEKWL